MITEKRGVVPKNIDKKNGMLRMAAAVLVAASLRGVRTERKIDDNDFIQDPPAHTLTLDVETIVRNKAGGVEGPKIPTQQEMLADVSSQFEKAQQEYEAQQAANIDQKNLAAKNVVIPNNEGIVTAQSVVVSPMVPSGKIRVETDNPTVFTRLANCETGSGQVEAPFYATWDSQGTYEGGYQFSNDTWLSLNSSHGYVHAYLAPPEIQTEAVQELLKNSSWSQQFPACSDALEAAGYITK